MRMWLSALFLITSACAEPPVTDATRKQTAPIPDQQLLADRATWYKKQVKQDCPSPRNDDGPALLAVREAHEGNTKQYVFGPRDPYKRRPRVLNNLRTRPNPRGEGVIVTAWKDGNYPVSIDAPQSVRSTDYSRHRSVWLVLDGRVYPLNTNAAGDVGRRFDGLPQAIQKRAGLVHNYERGAAMMDQLGFEENTFERRLSGGNPFPLCP